MYSFNQLAFAYGQPVTSGVLKASHEDFQVTEIMPVQPSGSGEHLWLHIEKKGCNTEWLATQLARLAGVKSMAVSYAGLKDRHGITSQWFSIHLPGQPDPDLSGLPADEVRILESLRHDRKLKRGTLSGNRFAICLRDLNGDLEALEQRLELIKARGVPNYFAEQRFGHGMNNLDKAEALFRGKLTKLKKHQRGLYLSAARSWVFNRILSERIQQQNWDRYLAGDVFMLQGKSACFADDASEDLNTRIESGEIHPTGALWGRGTSMALRDCLVLEQQIADEYPLFCEGLEKAGMKQERRSLRLMVQKLEWQFGNDQSIRLEFELGAGAYATAVIRECVSLVQ